MSVKVTHTDARYETLKRSRNLRWPATALDAAEEIELCETAAQVAETLQRIVNAGMRPTIRSGGHCYEDFVVNNPGGSILDLSLLSTDTQPNDGARFRISPGQQLGDVYLNLFKLHGLTIPAGSCYTVGAGGHIAGGGYGVLSRLHGLTVDWVTGIEILTVDNKGHVVMRHIDKNHDADLFRACRGGGGGNFGVMTGFLFDKLPVAPVEVMNGYVSFEWAAMTEEKFTSLLLAFGNYFDTRGRDPDTWGLFAILELSHSSSGHFGFGLQFCNSDGRCEDVKVLAEFLDRFEAFNIVPRHGSVAIEPPVQTSGKATPAQELQEKYHLERHLWLDAAVGDGSGGSERAKYKSCYMKQNFTLAEAKCIYKHMTSATPGIDARGFVLAVDSYGGAVNSQKMAEETAVNQRSSILKLQFQQYWQRPEEDSARLQFMRDFYTDLYSLHGDPQHAGTPFPGDQYEGCYINYPDKDMLEYAYWPQLYYGTGELYPALQKVKRHYDPNNIFHHAMSVRA